MTQVFSFSLRDRKGSVAIEYKPNRDPDSVGYGILGLAWPSSLATGLPVLEATVYHEAKGYEAVMGWIQLVRIHVAESSKTLAPGSEKAPAGDHMWVDGPPNLRGLGVPFISFGPRPTLFDAPAATESRVRFVADTFLTASPDALITRTSRPCLGLRWGYSTLADKAELIPVSELDAAAWHEALPALESQFPNWTFETEWFE